jgi:aerobic-type carbon monoxide dehydrogenase small subunit (CoxS/CutS family)
MSEPTAEKVSVTLHVNGAERTVTVEPRWLLSDVLRQEFGLTGVHIGCEHGVCGACTILMDGEPVRSCLTFAVQAEGTKIETVEALGTPEVMDPVQTAFWEKHGLQCGYCTPGMVLTAKALLDRVPNPTEAEIRHALSGNLCRCTGYQFIVEAVERAAEIRAQG